MRYAFLLLTLFILSWTACSDFADLDQIDETDANPEFAVPLIDTRLSITDLLDNFDDNSLLEVDTDGLIHFIYTGDVLSRTSDEVFAAVNDAIPPFIPVTSPRMALPFSSPDGVQIDQIIFKTGKIQYTFQSESEVPLAVKVYIPGLSKDGESFVQDHVVPAAENGESAVPFPPLVEIDLEGYELSAFQDSIYIQYDALRPDGTMDTLSGFLMTLDDLKFAYAEGFLGQQQYDTDRDTIGIDFFENLQQGRVYFEEPTIDIRINNSFGIPTRSVVNAFEVVSTTGEVIPLQSPVIDEEDEGIDFNYPSLNEVGETKTTLFSFTTENSNIDAVVGSTPSALIYDVDAATNPDTEVMVRGFVTDSSAFSVNVQVDLPLYANADGFLVADTFDLALGDFDQVESAEFKIITENELGLDVQLQAYFVDENGSIIDSLFAEKKFLVKGAPVDNNGVSMDRKTVTEFIVFDAERFEKIKSASQLLLESEFSTINDGMTSIKIFAEDAIGFRMGMKVKL